MSKIPLTNSNLYAYISKKDFKRVTAFNWILEKHGYVKRTSPSPQIRLHTFVKGNPPYGLEWDHKDGNRRNNKRSNLRAVTHAQNSQNKGMRSNNSSGFIGVHRPVGRSRWKAMIRVNGKGIHIGCFKNKIAAAKAYNKAAFKYFGEYARLNKLP